MSSSKIKQRSAIFMVLVMVLFLMPRQTVFASNTGMTISGGVLTAYNGGGGAVTIPSEVNVHRPRCVFGKADQQCQYSKQCDQYWR